ncbi:MAG TPA: ABC transporter ATP-binding protein [Acidimicrobiales bacterium]|nr:ABC transporter ATP-binding protein [Acidimicrobiales bacterium]
MTTTSPGTAPLVTEPLSPPVVASGSPLVADGVTLAYGERRVADDLSVAIPDGRITVIVGANACGKSTLLRALARLLAPAAGTVLLDGRDIHTLPTRAVASRLGILPQAPVAPEGITVADLVSRGRYPHQGWFRRWTADDEAALEAAMARTDTVELADRPVDELSGGQRQRVWIAMALAQGTDILLLDEPTTFLDLAHQIDVLDLVRDLNHEEGRTVVAVLHDLNQAFRYADHVIALRDGAVVAEGPPRDIATVELVEEVFGLACQVVADPVAGTPLVIPIGRRHRASPSV